MKSGRPPATPDMMAAICLMGGAMGEAVALNLLVPLMLVGVFDPMVREAMRAWMFAEERADARGDFLFEAWSAEEVGEDDTCVTLVPGGEGLGRFWRHVTRHGTVIVVLLQRLFPHHPVSTAHSSRGWAVRWRLSPLSQKIFFLPISEMRDAHALIVPVT